MSVAVRFVITQYAPAYPAATPAIARSGDYRVVIAQVANPSPAVHEEQILVQRWVDSAWRTISKKAYTAAGLPLPRAYTIYQTGLLFVIEQSVVGRTLDTLLCYAGDGANTDFVVTAGSGVIVSTLTAHNDVVRYAVDNAAFRQITTANDDFQTQAREFYGISEFTMPDTAATTLQECLWDIDVPLQGARVVFSNDDSEISLSTGDTPTRLISVTLDYQSDFLEGRFPCHLVAVTIDAGLDEWATDEEIQAVLVPFVGMKWCAVYHSVYDDQMVPYHLWLGTYLIEKVRYDRGTFAVVVEGRYPPSISKDAYLTHGFATGRLDAALAAAFVETDQTSGELLTISPRIRALPVDAAEGEFVDKLSDAVVLGKLVLTPAEWKQRTGIPFVGALNGTITGTTITYRFPSTVYANGDYALVAFQIDTGQNAPTTPTAAGWSVLARHNLGASKFVAVLGKSLTTQDLDANIVFTLPTTGCVIHEIAAAYRGAAPVAFGGGVEPALTTAGFAVVLAATPAAYDYDPPALVPDSDAPSIQGTPAIQPTGFSLYHRAYAGATGLAVPSESGLEWVTDENEVDQLAPNAVVMPTWAIPMAQSTPSTVLKREWLLCSADDLVSWPPIYLPRGAIIDELPNPEQTQFDFDIAGYGLQPGDLNAALAARTPYRTTVATVASPMLLPGRPVLVEVNGYYWSGQILRSKYRFGMERRQELEIALYQNTGQPVLDLDQPTGTALYTSVGEAVYINASWAPIEVPEWLSAKIVGWRLAFYSNGTLVSVLDIVEPTTTSFSGGPYPVEAWDYDLALTLMFSNNATSPTGVLTKTTAVQDSLSVVAGDQFARSGQSPLWYVR